MKNNLQKGTILTKIVALILLLSSFVTFPNTEYSVFAASRPKITSVTENDDGTMSFYLSHSDSVSSTIWALKNITTGEKFVNNVKKGKGHSFTFDIAPYADDGDEIKVCPAVRYSDGSEVWVSDATYFTYHAPKTKEIKKPEISSVYLNSNGKIIFETVYHDSPDAIIVSIKNETTGVKLINNYRLGVNNHYNYTPSAKVHNNDLLKFAIAYEYDRVQIWGDPYYFKYKNNAATDYEYAIYPAATMNITQVAYETDGLDKQYGYKQTSHDYCNAIDMTSNTIFAPFTGKVVYCDKKWGLILLQSLDKVYFSDGTLDYMTVGFMHSNNISSIASRYYNGEEVIINQGETFYTMGNAPESNGYGIHADIAIYRGKVSSLSTYGNGDTYAFNAFHIDRTRTTVYNAGAVESGHWTNYGAPSNWANEWHYIN